MSSIQLDSSNPLRYSGISDNDIGRIVHACAAIAEALNSSNRIFPFALTSTFDFSFVNGVYNCYENDMVERGWCPFIIRFLQRNVCTLGYASSMEPPLRRDVVKGGHNSCSHGGCGVNNIDTSSYVVQHVTRSCPCSWKGPPLREVVDALAQDNPTIPVVAVAAKESPVDDLSVTCRTGKDTPYVAISHVWVDGLGSNTETGLPSCQLRRIASLTTSLIPGGAFWMDSLCVPRQKDMRRKAIGLMAQTYRDAEIVLVIDAGIRSCSVNSSTEEKLLRVLTSGWMQRLWTLQEAILSRKLVFEFAERTVSVEELIPRDERDLLDVVLTQLASELWRLYKRRFTGGKLGIGDVASFLRTRTTSRLEDETLAISSLLDVDAYELAGLPHEKRMMTMLARLRNIPANIIFLSGSKLSEQGFRWAPATFMIRYGPSLSITNNDAVCTSQGLIAQYQCIRFHTLTLHQATLWRLWDHIELRGFAVDDPESFEGTITCNGLLLTTIPSYLNPFVVGVLVLIEDHNQQRNIENGEGQSTLSCIYLRKVFVKHCGGKRREEWAQEGYIVSDTTSIGCMELRIT
ncbi:hypothetical protein WOLCODRAFT_139356 [Wolfiporia cocos MD-104 SS10]|uniref:Heterokaryon incompatibility domain-containing protein n=1 Tax=Wolfiporia cocos (strain MD-104) TaxID=742152 RepID=A0A2H3K7D1_WOLCO|nr:hypothetical protein WOLCODRAFT_139356 [Wolfiporia cocos MD-104 SS10]